MTRSRHLIFLAGASLVPLAASAVAGCGGAGNAPAVELEIRLKELQAERLRASKEGLAADPAYMADLEDEIAEVSNAYLEAAVTEIATLRAELFGPQRG